jgi:hypothetical protein
MKKLEVHLTVDFVPCPPEHEEAWKVGMGLLLDLLREEWKRKEDGHGEQKVGGSKPDAHGSHPRGP